MKKSLTTFMLFSLLLLAVGWTNDASAQKLPQGKPWYKSAFFQRMTQPTMMNGSKEFPSESLDNATPMEGIDDQLSKAPMRANYTQTAPVTHIKSWYDGKSYTWYDADGNSQGTASYTDAVTDSCQMYWFIRSLYSNPEMPGIKYSEALDKDLAYDGADYGYWISGDVTQDIYIAMSGNCYITYIAVYDWEDLDNPITYYDVDNTSLPTGWSQVNSSYFTRSYERVYTSSGYQYWYYWKLTDDSETEFVSAFKISADLLTGHGGVYVYVNARQNASTSATRDNSYYVTRYDYNKETRYVGEKHLLPYTWTGQMTLAHGPITPPTENGYSVVLVKLEDDVPNLPDADMYTFTDSALYSYFNKYVDELQLLTDGLRVNEGTAAAGTLFAYTGDVNKFFYISKGKEYPIGNSSENYFTTNSNTGVYGRGGDRAPFYSMYEEFSPFVDSGTEDHSDLYDELKKGVTYPILHDCQSVIWMDHWFTLASDDGSTENRVNSLVLYIPDQRGMANSRSYEEAHQPTVGMYMIDLYADIEPSSDPDYYTTTVTWQDNLDVITHSDGIPQTYYLYEIWDMDKDGDMDTTLVYVGPNTTWTSDQSPHTDFLVGDPTAYDVYYYVVGVPTAATNPDTFFAKSNTDDVTVPGKTDFIGLQWWRYESDYVTDNGDRQEVNYYRNWLAPHALSTSTQAGISAGNVGTTGRILTLYREETPIIDLELVMNGTKAYYRIKYINRSTNQQVEPGYNENTGELNNK